MPRLNDIVPRPRWEDQEDKAGGEIGDPEATGVSETDLGDSDRNSDDGEHLCKGEQDVQGIVGFKASRVDRVATPYPPDQQKQAEKDGNNGARERAQ